MLGVWGYYYFADTALVLRVLMVLGGLLAAGGVAWLSAPGKEFFAFAQEAWAEAGRVSWPTRKETMQTTAIVFAFVVDHGAVPLRGRHDARVDRQAADRAGRVMMSKKWFVVHAYSGFEKSVQRALAERIKRSELQEQFGQILVPVEEVVEMKSGAEGDLRAQVLSRATCWSRWR